MSEAIFQQKRLLRMSRQRLANRQLALLSQQNNILDESYQENRPEQENCESHLEIRVTEETLFPAHPLQCPGILNDHDKQGDDPNH